jgi:L-lysine 2,3-aminomutase
MIPAATVPLHVVPAHESPAQPAQWQKLWREAVRTPQELLSLLGLESLASRVSAQAAMQFPLRVPRGFVARMRHGDSADPLLRQVLPFDQEMQRIEGF